MPFIHHVRRHMPKDPWWHVFGLSFGLAFALMLMAARLHPLWLDGIDSWVEAVVQPLQTFADVETFLVITVLGSAVGIPTIALGTLYFLRHNRLAQLQLVLLLIFSSVSMGSAKMFVERARPNVLMWLDPSNTYSFPSGHATLSAAFYGFVSVQLYRRSRTTFTRFLSLFVPMLLIALISLSRIMLNYHYFTDVLAGILLGLFWLAVIFMLPKPRSGLLARR